MSDYGIPCNAISTRSQLNYGVHQTISNIIYTISLQQKKENPWEEILISIMFAIRSTVHTTTQHIPSQLVFALEVS